MFNFVARVLLDLFRINRNQGLHITLKGFKREEQNEYKCFNIDLTVKNEHRFASRECSLSG